MWLHAVDLAAGTEIDDLPADLAGVLLDDATATLNTRPGCPPLRLLPVNNDQIRRLGPTGTTTIDVTAPVSLLLAWVTGRAGPAAVGAPAALNLPRWL